MKRILIFSLLFMAACTDKQEEVTTQTNIKPDSIAAPQVTVLADLPDSLQPKTVAITKKPVRRIIKNEPKPVDAHGGKADFTNFTTDDGLVSDGVYCSITDSKGNIWFGILGGGVSRYNGQAFTSFAIDHRLDKNVVWSIAEDKTGNIWFGTMGGVSRYDGQTFTTFTTANGLADNNVSSIAEDKMGNLWFGTRGGGVSRYDGQSFTSFTTADGLANNNVLSIAEDKTGSLWFGTYGGGMSRYDGQTFTSFTTAHGLANNNVLRIVEDKRGNLWFGTQGGGVSRYDGQTFTTFTTAHGLANNNVLSIAEDKMGNLWFGTYGGGVSRYDGQTFTSFTTAHGLAENNVLSIAEDKMGNLWFGTYSGGVSRYNGQSFTSFSTVQGLTNNIVWSIAEDKTGSLWFGTEGGGVSRYDGQTFTSFTTGNGLADKSVLSIAEDKRGNLWFGTRGGMSRYDGQTFTTFTTANGLASNRILSITEDKRGNLWFGTYGGGVSRYDGETFTSFTTAHGLADNNVLSIVEDKRGNLWFGTEGGVSRYDGQSFTSFSTVQGLANNVVLSIAEDKTGNLWFGTEEGLSVMSEADVKQSSSKLGVSGAALFKNITTTDGRPDNFVTQMLQMPDGRMAVGTDLGITLYTPSKDLSTLDNIDIYNSNTGYPLKDVNVGQNTMFLDSKGILWAATGSGKTPLVRFDYAALHKDTLPPTVVINGIKINEETISWNSLRTSQEVDSNVMPPNITEEVTRFGKELTASERDTLLQKFSNISFDSISPFNYLPQNLVLPYKDNHITIDFYAIETGRNFMVNYQYILEGYDDKWSPITKKGTAVFGHMHEGNYTFKVKAQSPEGVWCAPIAYTFEVLPPWYRTWWMYLIYGLLFLLALRIFSKWRERSLRADKDRLEHEVAERTSEIKEEKRKSDELLHNILPEEIASELKERGATTAQQYDKVTVLFTDFVNFTQAGERMGSQELVEELHNCFEAFDNIMGKYGIEKIKTIGDAYLAVCGLPTVDEHHAEKVVIAAGEIATFMQKRYEDLGDKTFEIRIGIHSGSVVAGIVGVKKFAYDIWGDTVNTAARMESKSEAGKINISHATYELVQDKFTCTYRGELEAKNKGKLKMYFVEA